MLILHQTKFITTLGLCAFIASGCGTSGTLFTSADRQADQAAYHAIMAHASPKTVLNLGRRQGSPAQKGSAGDYRKLPEPRALASCLRRTGKRAAQISVTGSVYATGVTPLIRVIRQCRLRFAKTGCACHVVDVNGTALVKGASVK